MNKNKQFLFVFLISVLFFNGCSGKNNRENLYVTQAQYLSVSFAIIDDKGRTYDGKEEIVLPKEIKTLSLYVVVENPAKYEYQIWSELVVKNQKTIITKILFSNLESNFRNPYKIKCPLEEGEEKKMFIVSLRNNKGQILFELLPLEYQVQRKEIYGGGE